MRKQAGQVLADAEEGGLPQLLGAVAAAEKTDAEVRQRAAASMFQMLSPTITAVSIAAPRRSTAARNGSVSGQAYLWGDPRFMGA